MKIETKLEIKMQTGRTAQRYAHFTLRRFYRAMHFSAKRGIGIACRLSVRL